MKLKSLILTLCLSLFALSGLLAQEKYEYATVLVYDNALHVVSEVTETVQYKLKEREVVVVKKLNELAQNGWDIYTVTEVSSGLPHTSYHLRKKKN